MSPSRLPFGHCIRIQRSFRWDIDSQLQREADEKKTRIVLRLTARSCQHNNETALERKEMIT